MKSIRKAAGRVILVCLIAIAALSLYNIIKIIMGYAEENSAYEETRKVAETEKGLDWDALREMNGDVIGWIELEGTKINYPIVQGSDNSRYLNVLFDGQAGNCGTLFADYRHAEPFRETNTIVYGHNMKDGTMFGSLRKFKEEKYLKEHEAFKLSTPEEDYELRVVAVLVIDPDDELYRTTFADEAEVNAWLSRIRSKAMLLTEEPLEKDSRYVMLSTCSTPDRTLRDVVIGKLYYRNG